MCQFFVFYIILIRRILTVFDTILAIMTVIRKAFKFRLNPTTEQTQQMVEFAGANRFVWNKALALNLARLENKQPILWYFELVYWLGLWKQSEEYGFLKAVHSQPLQQTLKDLSRAFSDAFDKTQPLKRIPRFKKKGAGGARDSFRYPQGCKLDEKANRVYESPRIWRRL